jgi:TatD DNase family protein
MIDTHCHLDAPEFDADRDAVVARARAAGVEAIVVPAVRPATWGAVTALAERFPEVVVALGVHPQVVPFLDDAERTAAGAEWRLDGAPVAIGECGLDGATGAQDEQERLFRRQIGVARELRLPLIVHVLKAHDAAPRILAEERAREVGGILHSYSGGAELVGRYAELGFAFSFAGPVTYANARRPIEAARAVPDHLLLAETDAPDQAPTPHRGGRNEPAFVTEIHAALARARGLAPAALVELVTANARRILRLS